MKNRYFKTLFGGIAALLLLSSVTLADRPDSARNQLRPDIIKTHENFGTAEVVSGNFAISSGSDRESRARTFIQGKNDIFKINDPSSELKLLYERTDKFGRTHLRFQQEYNGLEVWGCQTIIHFLDERTIYLVGGQTIATPAINTTPSIEAGDAAAIATNDFNKEMPGASLESKTELLIYPGEGNPRLAYLVTVTSPNDGSIRWRVFVDAQNGTIIFKFSDIHFDGPDVGSGIDVLGITRPLNIYNSGGQYQLRDVTHNGEIRTYYDYYGAEVLSTDPDGDKIWDDSEYQKQEVSGHYFTQLTYEYFLNTFGRDSYNDLGSDIIVNMLTTPGYNNAYWNGQAINMGEGDGILYRPFSGALDVVAHEISHGVTEYNGTGGLIYGFQSGALNESFSDVFGVMVDRDDWLMGEDIALYTTNPFIRSLANPNLKGHPKSMDEYQWLDASVDNGGVHRNSGIPNHAAYLASELFGLGREKVEQIWYRTLTTYLTPSSGMHFWAAMTLQATEDLYSATEISGIYEALKLVALLPAYAEPSEFYISALIGETPTTDTVWIYNSGPGDSYDVSFTTPSIPDLSIGQVSGSDPIPVGDSAGFEISLGAAEFDECDLGLTIDTVDFVLETGVFSTTIRIPIIISIGKTSLSGDFFDINTACLDYSGFSNTKIFDFVRGIDAVYEGSLMIGLVDGNDTTVYRSLYDADKLNAVDTIDNEPGSKSYDFVVADGRIQGTATYLWDAGNLSNCDFIIAEFDLYNPCDTPLTIISAAYTDFDINTSTDNTCLYDSPSNLIYVQDGSGDYAAGMALLSGTARNLRAINNPALVWNAGWTDGVAYNQMAQTTNATGTPANDYSALLTFEQITLGANDTAHYSIVYMYHTSGNDWFDDILTRVNQFYGTSYVCGDASGDGNVNLLDILYLIAYKYNTPPGPAPVPEEAGDANADGNINLLDILYLIAYKYNTPPGPEPQCP